MFKKEDFIIIEESLKKKLKKNRFRHTIGVAHTCACLAMRYNEDIDNAYMAGLLHDCAKGYDDKKMLDKANKFKLEISEFEKNNPFILHGKVGSEIARRDYNITNQDILNAISYHTTGRPAMSLLEKIVFLGDYIEQGRCEADNLRTVRALAFEDIDECIRVVLKDTLYYLAKKGAPVDDMTEKTYNFYINNH